MIRQTHTKYNIMIKYEVINSEKWVPRQSDI